MILSLKQWLLIALFAVYSYGLWHVSSKYTSSGYEKEKVVASQDKVKAIEEEQKDTLAEKAKADKFYKDFMAAKQKNSQVQRKIETEVAHEIEKPDYTRCAIPDSGVRLIEQAIDNSNSSLSSDK